MKTLIFAILLSFNQIVLASPITLKPNVIYGIDDRTDIYDSSDALMKEISKSVLVQMTEMTLEKNNDKYRVIHSTQADQGICPEDKYSNQIVGAQCSGFLINKDTVVTAGHCVRDQNECDRQFWVFDFANYDFEKSDYEFTTEQVFTCKNIISREKNSTTGLDYAVIKLDRATKERRPLKIRTSGSINPDAIFTIIGSPNGIPLKITTGAVLRDNSKAEYFTINSDTFGGNSGSPVVDTRTGLVEGILVRGDTDFERIPGRECIKSIVRDNDGGRGEDATRITQIKLK